MNITRSIKRDRRTGYKLLAMIISRRQKSPIAWKELVRYLFFLYFVRTVALSMGSTLAMNAAQLQTSVTMLVAIAQVCIPYTARDQHLLTC